MEYQLRQLQNSYKYKKAYLDEHAQELDVLVLGSSHAYYNINPEYLDGKVFNAGAVSQSLDLDLAILRKYQSQLTNLKTVVLPISYFTFYGQLRNSTEKWRMKDYVLYLKLDVKSSLKDHFEVLSIKPKNNLKKWWRSYNQTKVTLPCSSLGWGEGYAIKGTLDLEVSGIATAHRHSEKDVFSEESKQQFNEGTNDLKAIVKWAENRKIKVVLLTPPATSSYTSHLNTDQLNLVTEQLHQLSNDYANCTYYNWLQDQRFSIDDFYDSDHLNHRGAKKLTQQLNTLIQ